jgi:hypothetical protein
LNGNQNVDSAAKIPHVAFATLNERNLEKGDNTNNKSQTKDEYEAESLSDL